MGKVFDMTVDPATTLVNGRHADPFVRPVVHSIQLVVPGVAPLQVRCPGWNESIVSSARAVMQQPSAAPAKHATIRR